MKKTLRERLEENRALLMSLPQWANDALRTGLVIDDGNRLEEENERLKDQVERLVNATHELAEKVSAYQDALATANGRIAEQAERHGRLTVGLDKATTAIRLRLRDARVLKQAMRGGDFRDGALLLGEISGSINGELIRLREMAK